MDFKVRVIGDKWNGKVVNQNPNNPEYGSIRFEQKRFNVSNNFLNLATRVCFRRGIYDELVEYAEINGLKHGVELPGILYILESKIPFYKGQEPKINPETGCIVLIDGESVYRNCFYDETGTKADSLIQGVKSIGDKIKDVNKYYNYSTSSLGNY